MRQKALQYGLIYLAVVSILMGAGLLVLAILNLITKSLKQIKLGKGINKIVFSLIQRSDEACLSQI